MPDRQRSFRVEAIVLRHSDWDEADRLLVLFTREMGKQRAVAKGVRKLRSRKAGHLEPFNRVSLQLARGRDLPYITQAETLDPYPPLKADLLLLGYASYAVELLDRFTYEEGENRSLYRLLADTLGRLSSGDEPGRALRYYEIRLLDLLGFRPQLYQCAQCGSEIQPEDQYFSPQDGGVLCPSCGVKTPRAGPSSYGARPSNYGARPISLEALKYLRYYQRSGYADTARLRIQPAIAREMEGVMQDYLTFLLERSLNSPAFIKQMRPKG